MVALVEFKSYLKSLLENSQQEKNSRENYVPSWTNLPLKVETHNSSSLNQELKQTKEEKYLVLEGLRKYALEQVLLVGKPGFGKSTALLQLQKEEAQRCLEAIEQDKDEIPQIPVLVELRNLKDSILKTIKDKLDWWIDLDDQAFKKLFRDRKILILLDGLNELPSDSALREVEMFRQSCLNLKTPLIITTRELGSALATGEIKKLEMLPLTEPQIREFVTKRLPDTGDQLLRQLKGKLKELGQTPLLLQMLCEVLSEKRNIPQNRGDLFRKEFARRYEKFKPERLRNVSGDSRRFAFDLLCYLAFKMVQGYLHADPFKPTSSWISISKSKAEGIIAEFLSNESNPKSKAKEWLEDLLEWHLLQVASEPDRIEFHHQLFQEYYAGEYLAPQLEKLSDEELQQNYLNYLKWTEVIAIAMSFIELEALAERITKSALNVDLKLGARLSGEVQASLQEKTVAIISELAISDMLKIKLMGLTKSSFAIPYLKQITEYQCQSSTKHEIIRSLTNIYSPAARNLLRNLLEEADNNLKFEIACALADYEETQIVPILQHDLNNKQNCFRALIALEKFGQMTFIDLLNEALDRKILTISNENSSIIFHLKPNKHSNILSFYKRLLNGEDDDIRHKAAYLLESEGSEEAFAILAKLWKDDNRSIRYSIQNIFKGQEREDLLFELQNAFFEENVELRKKAVETIRQIGTVSYSVINKLFHVALLDDDFLIRNSASTALSYIGNPTVIKVLSDALEQEDIKGVNYGSSHSLAIIALLQIRKKETISILAKVLLDQSKSSVIRKFAAEAIGEIGESSVNNFLLSLLQKERDEYVVVSLIFALGKLGFPDLEPIIIELLKYSDDFVRKEAVKTLVKISTKLANEGLVISLKDQDFSIRFTAASALGRNNNEIAIPVLIEALGHHNCIGLEDCSVSEEAIDILNNMGKKTIPYLEKVLSSSDYQLQKNARKTIEKFSLVPQSDLINQHQDIDFTSLNNVSLLNRDVQNVKSQREFYNYEICGQAIKKDNDIYSSFYRDLDRVISQIQENPELRKKADGEDRLTIEIVGQLKILDYQVEHEPKIGGHVDISVRKDDCLWLGEAKIFRDNNYLWEGFLQLTTRYSTGDTAQDHGGLLIYIFEKDTKSIMEKWQRYLINKNLPEYNFESCKDRDLSFISSHKHNRSGRTFYVKHIPVILNFSPEDRSARRRKKKT